MNTKNKKLLKEIFEDPIRSDIRWNDVERLINSLDGSVNQGKGSRVWFYLNGQIGRFHKPHPNQEIEKYAVKDLRAFLEVSGVLPEK